MSETSKPDGFSARYVEEEPVRCSHCWRRGVFHWPSLADHKPTQGPPAPATPHDER